MQSPELHYRVQDGEGQDVASSLRPGLPLFSSDLVPNVSTFYSQNCMFIDRVSFVVKRQTMRLMTVL
jgi:hypothetical protein